MRAKTRIFNKDVDTSVTGIIERAIKQYWTLPAYTDYSSDINYTYADVAKNIARLHEIYRQLGIQQGDKIALCSKNCSNWAISMLSILSYGAVAVPVLHEFNAEQIKNIYEHSESKLFICASKYSKIIPEAKMMNVDNFEMYDKSVSVSLDDYASLTKEEVSYKREDPEALGLLSYTSGSTGHSKGVMLPFRAIWSNIIFADEVLDFGPGDKTMAILPMAHMYGFAFDFIFEFSIGCHVHFMTKTPSPNILIKAFNEIKPVVVIVVPLILEKIVIGKVFPILRTPTIRAMTKIPLLRDVIYRQIRNKLYSSLGGNFYECIVGGAAFSKDVEDFLHKIHFPYTVGYGMTECAPIIGYEDWHDFVKGSCGKAAPRMEVQVLSPDPENIPGEIVCRGMNTMLGYYKNEEETAAAIDNGKWLHTGDLGTIDKDGNIFIRGRKKTMLLGANGQNIYPEEIEDVIVNHTIFDETVVVQRGEQLVALVYISESSLAHHGLTPKTLTENLPAYKRHINSLLPKFAGISNFEVMPEEFEKTPKRSIKRYLYK